LVLRAAVPPPLSASATGAAWSTLATTSSTPASAPSAVPTENWTPHWADQAGRWADDTMPWLVLAWLGGVGALSLRLLLGWRRVVRTRRSGTAVLESRLLERFRNLERRMGLARPVRLLKSAAVSVPTVVGWLRPAILLPAGCLTGLSPSQLELLLAHELAHIRRWDHWVNLLQVAIETLLFYHPAVWWVSRCVREEREHCCDDLAVAACGDGVAYARALATMEELRQLEPQLALAATGGSLLERVRRLLGVGVEPRDWRRTAGGALWILAVLLTGAAVVLYLISPVRYEATTRLQIGRLMDVHWLREALTGSPPPPDTDDLPTQIQNLRSRTLIESLIKKEELAEDSRYTGAVDLAAAVLRDIRVSQVPASRLVDVRVLHTRPQKARDIAHTLANEFIEQNALLKQKETLDQLFFLQNQASGLERDVQKAEEALQSYRLRSGFVSFDSPNAVADDLLREQRALTEATSRQRATAMTLEVFQQHTNGGKPPEAFPPFAADPSLRQGQMDLFRLEADVEVILKSYGEQHPNVQEARAKVEAARSVLRQIALQQAAILESDAGVASAHEREQVLLVHECEERYAEWNKAKLDYDVLQRKAESSKALFSLVLGKMKQVELLQKDKSNNVRVVDQAATPQHPVYPLRPVANLLLGAAGLACVTGFFLPRTVRRREAEVAEPAEPGEPGASE
ncbi:MAG: hypothetical protein FJ387_28800, partial [Verrucomicrobia bacterium]|nr:hypothetical protein [Verrucomicrobiota bacterium]